MAQWTTRTIAVSRRTGFSLNKERVYMASIEASQIEENRSTSITRTQPNYERSATQLRQTHSPQRHIGTSNNEYVCTYRFSSKSSKRDIQRELY